MTDHALPAPARGLGRRPTLGAAVRQLAEGREEDPRWLRPALLAVTALAALLCFWALTISGYSNEYYAAAAKSGSESWKAWFFGSLDPGSFITVDKPPLSLWLMGLSVAGLWLTRRAARTDLARAGWVLFGVWAIVHVGVFSTQKGIFHPYYVGALAPAVAAPAVAALAGAGVVVLWQAARRSWVAWATLAAATMGTAWLAVDLLGRTPGFHPVLRTLIPLAAAVAIVAGLGLRLPALRRALPVAAVAASLALLAGPASYAVDNVGHALNGNNVLAGPTSAGGTGAFGGPGGGQGGAPSGRRPTGTQPAAARTGGPMGGGGLSSQAIAYLKANQGSAKYLVAASGSQTTASVILATGEPVVTIGGFSGSDPAPSVAQLAAMVERGELKYVLLSSGGGPGGGASSALSSWVTAHGKAVSAVTVSGGTLYRVTA